MSTPLWVYAAVALALLGIGFGLGGWLFYKVGHADGLAVQAQAVTDARSERDAMATQLQSTRTGLAKLKQRLQQQIDEHARLAMQAKQDLQRRDTRIAALKQQQTQLGQELRHDPDNQTLAGVPVPPALARRLWPGAHDHTP